MALQSNSFVSLTGSETLTNKTLTLPKINEDVALTSTATELNLLDGATVTTAEINKLDFTESLLVGHTTTGTLNAAERNTGVGFNSLDALTSGDSNTAIGRNAGSSVTSGSSNTYIGQAAGNSSTTASENTAVGDSALKTTSTSGSQNTALGFEALELVNTGDHNVGIGWKAGDSLTSGKGNVLIGSNVEAASNTGDRQLTIGGYDGSTTTTWITGDSSGNVSVRVFILRMEANKELRFYEGANYVGFEAPALSADKIWVLPAADGSANQVLKTDGSGNLGFADAASGGLEWQTIVTGSSFTAVAGRAYWVNTTSNACTITLPSSASAGDELLFVDYSRKWGTNAVTLNRNGLKIQGGTANAIFGIDGQAINIVYSGSTNGWIPVSDITTVNSQAYSIDFLVIAGGGGGGSTYGGGGGGAGGFRTSTQIARLHN